MQSILSVFTLISWGIVKGQAAERGNSLVTCTACQTVQAQIDNWSCDINCRVANGNNGTCCGFVRSISCNSMFSECGCISF